MPKLLWIGDSPLGNTGFGRVAQNIIPRLQSLGWTVAQLGLNEPVVGPNEAHPFARLPWDIWPAIKGGDLYGFAMVGYVVRNERPDVILVNNDLWICEKYREQLLAQIGPDAENIPMVCYFPVDGGGYSFDMVSWLYRPDYGFPAENLIPVTYTEFGRDVIMKAAQGGNANTLFRPHVIPHGVDTSVYYPMDKSEARAALAFDHGWDIPDDDTFLVLNANRNQVRKRIDLTIQAFIAFMRRNPDAKAKLWLHMTPNEQNTSSRGWDTLTLFQRLWREAGMSADPKKHLMYTSAGFNNYQAVDENTMRLIYNAADVGINTCMGEGWGLVQHEHAACGRPQIVGAHSAFTGLWGDAAKDFFAHNIAVLNEPELGIDRYIGAVDEDQVDDRFWSYAEIINEYYASLKPQWRGTFYEQRSAAFLAAATKPEYNWTSIAARFHELLLSSIGGVGQDDPIRDSHRRDALAYAMANLPKDEDGATEGQLSESYKDFAKKSKQERMDMYEIPGKPEDEEARRLLS